MSRAKYFLIGLAALVFVFGGCQQYADYSDRQALRKLFRVPGEVQMLDYRGFAAIGGTFQREGLKVSAIFAFTPQQAEQYLESAVNNGWRPLPLPRDILAESEKWGNLVNQPQLRAKKGWYLLKTAGDNVLYNPNPRLCRKASELRGDIILGILTLPDLKLYAAVASGY